MVDEQGEKMQAARRRARDIRTPSDGRKLRARGETRLSQQEVLCLYLERERQRTEAKLTLSIFTKIFKTGFHSMKASPPTVDLNFDKTRDVNLLCLSSMTLSLAICNVESH